MSTFLGAALGWLCGAALALALTSLLHDPSSLLCFFIGYIFGALGLIVGAISAEASR